MCQQGGEIAHDFEREITLQGGETHVECMHSSGKLHLFRGSCVFARCVEHLPLLEGLAVFLAFRVLLVVLSPLPLLEG
jgi:hypothetical protein